MSTKHALLIGINYIGSDYELQGCINDTIMMRKYLLDKRGYLSENISCMRDDNTFFKSPTRTNILDEITKLTQKSGATELFLHYSGHGSYQRDKSGDEKDGQDELICPVDFKFISDDTLYTIMQNVSPNVNMYIVMDCCFSGTNIDLPYLYSVNGGKLVLSQSEKKKYKSLVNKKIYSISGCKDNQTSADAYGIYDTMTTSDSKYNISSSNRSGGALTVCLLNALNENIEFTKTLPTVHRLLISGRYSQRPQLSCCSLLNKVVIKPKAVVPKKSKTVIVTKIKILSHVKPHVNVMVSTRKKIIKKHKKFVRMI